MDIQPIRKIAFNICREFAKELRFVRGIPSEVTPISQHTLKVKYEDTTSGEIKSEEFDLVVPSVGITPRGDSGRVSEIFGMKCDSVGFFVSTAPELPNYSTRDGVFLAGTCAGPKDIRDSVSQGRAAAMAAIQWIDKVSK